MVWPSLEGAMPAINLAEVVDRAMAMTSTTALWGGLGVVGLGFMIRVTTEFYKSSVEEGYAPRYAQEVLVLVGFVALMAGYKPVVLTIVGLVSGMGADLVGAATVEQTFAARMARFNQHVNQIDPGSRVLSALSFEGILTRIFQLVTMFLYVGVQCVMFIIKAVQMFSLAAIITYGPFLLALSTLGSFFVPLGIAWFWALVEVSAWSFTVDILLHVFATYGGAMPEQFSYVQEIIITLTLMALLVATIPLTASLARGHSAASLAQSASYMAGRAVTAAGFGASSSPRAAGRAWAGAKHAAAGGARAATTAAAAAAGALGRGIRRDQGGSDRPGPKPDEGSGGASPAPEAPYMADKLRGRQK